MVEDDTVVPEPQGRSRRATESDLDDTVVGTVRAAGASPQPDFSDTVLVPRGDAPDTPDTRTRRSSGPPTDGARPAAPAPYRFRVGAGAAVQLDATVRVGRAPRPPRIPVTPEPRLVTVESPRQEVSSTHLELRQLGATVVATDLRSTNGSTVRMPGNAARILAAGESVVVSPGTLIELGDGVTLEILPPHRPE